MTYSQYDKPVPNTSKEGNQDTEFTVFGKKQEHGSHPGEKSLPDVIHEKIEHGKNTIQQMAHNWRDDLMEPFEDRSDQNEVEQMGKKIVDTTKEQSSRAKRELNGIFKESNPTGTAKDHESYQEMLQDKIDAGTNTIKDITHKMRDEIMETFRGGPDQNDIKQAGEELRDKTKEKASKVGDSWNGIMNDSGISSSSINGSSGFDEGFKSFGQEAKEEYQKDQKHAEEAKVEWGNTLESIKHSVEEAMGNFHPNDNFNREIDGNFSEYEDSEVLRESAGGAILPPFDPTNEPYSGDDALFSSKLQK